MTKKRNDVKSSVIYREMPNGAFFDYRIGRIITRKRGLRIRRYYKDKMEERDKIKNLETVFPNFTSAQIKDKIKENKKEIKRMKEKLIKKFMKKGYSRKIAIKKARKSTSKNASRWGGIYRNIAGSSLESGLWYHNKKD